MGELAADLGRIAVDGGLRRALGETGRARVGREFRWGDKLGIVAERLGVPSEIPGKPEAN